MTRRRLRLLALAAVCAVVSAATTACSNTLSDAATVTYRDSTGKHVVHITRDDFEKQLRGFVGNKHFPELVQGNPAFAPLGDGKNVTNATVAARYLQQLIANVPWDAEFDALHLKVTADDVARARDNERLAFALPSEVKRDASGQPVSDASGQPVIEGPGIVFSGFPKSIQNLLAERQARVTAVANYYAQATPEKVQQFYEEFGSQICPSNRIVSHILVKDKNTADQIYAQLQQGKSFAQYAQTKSIDTGTAKNGGLLGCLKRGEFVKEFDTAAFAASYDTPTAPVKSQFGYHIILVQHPTPAALQGDIQQAMSNAASIAFRTRSEKVWVNPLYGSAHLGANPNGLPAFLVDAPNAPSPRVARDARPTPLTVPAG
jgi:parvulin-like peptidyl-prolyl isomerase